MASNKIQSTVTLYYVVVDLETYFYYGHLSLLKPQANIALDEYQVDPAPEASPAPKTKESETKKQIEKNMQLRRFLDIMESLGFHRMALPRRASPF